VFASLKALKGMTTNFLVELMFNYDIIVENYVHFPFQALEMTTKSNVYHSRVEHYTTCVKDCLGIQEISRPRMEINGHFRHFLG